MFSLDLNMNLTYLVIRLKPLVKAKRKYHKHKNLLRQEKTESSKKQITCIREGIKISSNSYESHGLDLNAAFSGHLVA